MRSEKKKTFCQINEHTNECGPKLFATIISSSSSSSSFSIPVRRGFVGDLVMMGRRRRTERTEGRDEWETWECNKFTPSPNEFSGHARLNRFLSVPRYQQQFSHWSGSQFISPICSVHQSWVGHDLEGGWQEVRDYWIWNPIVLLGGRGGVGERVVCSCANFHRFPTEKYFKQEDGLQLDSWV